MKPSVGMKMWHRKEVVTRVKPGVWARNVLGKGHRVYRNVQYQCDGKGLEDATNFAKYSINKHVPPTSSPKNNNGKSELKTNLRRSRGGCGEM